MQTFLVHMREPARTARELGLLRFLGLQLLIGGMLLSALVHPWIYVLAALELATGALRQTPPWPLGDVLYWIGIFNFVAGHGAGMALGLFAVKARGEPRLALHTLMMPAYWLLISFACYRALLQLATSPFYWEKTAHRRRSQQEPAQKI
jgi:hypothetical protein